MTGGVQQRSSDEDRVGRIEPADRVSQVDRNAFGDARGDSQYLVLARRAGHTFRLDRTKRRRPVHQRHKRLPRRALERLGELADKVSSLQPAPVADQQLNGCFSAEDTLGLRSQSCSEILEAGSK